MKVLGIGSLVLALAAADAHAESVQLIERPGHVTEARMIVDATPSEIYSLVTSYGSWPAFLTDIRSVNVESGGREDALVRFKSKALRNTVTVQFRNEPGKVISFHGVKGPPGGRAHGSYTLTPIEGGKRTQVTVQLYMDVVGPGSLFVRDKALREMRQTKLRSDLEDVSRFFATRPNVSRAEGSAAH